MVGHRISTERRLRILGHQIPHFHLVPISAESFIDIHVAELDFIVLRNIYLNISAATEIERLALGQFYDELFEESGDIAVRHHFALPFLDTENGCRNLDFQILLDLDLTTQTPMVLLLLAGEEVHLGRQDIAAAFQDLTAAHSARTAAAACRRQKYSVIGQRNEQRISAFGAYDLLASVDVDFHLSRRSQLGFRQQQQRHEQQRNYQKSHNRNYYSHFHIC